MTRMIFFPGEGSCVVMDSPLAAEVLTRAVNDGEWTLPAPFGLLIPGEDEGAVLQACCQNEIVIVTLNRHGSEISGGRTAWREFSRLSIRQHQVLAGLADGLSTRQIAARLRIAERTVLYHIARIKEMFGSVSRAQSVGKAASLGLWLPRPRGRRNGK